MRRFITVARKFVEIQQIRIEQEIVETNGRLKYGTQDERVETWQKCVYLLKRARKLETVRWLLTKLEGA